MKTVLISIFVLFMFVVVDFSQDKKKCEVSWTVEVGLYSSYVGQDVGDTFYPHKVVQGSTNVEFCGNKRVSGGFNLWQSLSTKENPVDGGTEFDIAGFVSVKLTDKTSLNVDTAVFFVPGAKIYKAGAKISRSLKFSEKVDGEMSSTFNYYRTNIQDELPGGVVNKFAVTLNRSLKKFNVTVEPAFSMDNNPFSLGRGKVVGMAFLNGGVSYPLTDRLSISAMGGISNPVFGDTNRSFRKFGGIGTSYVFK